MKAMVWNGTVKMGDSVAVTHFPENYYLHIGEKLLDKTGLWSFKYNPYVVQETIEPITETLQLWGGANLEGKTIAETLCNKFNIPCKRIMPKLYVYEDVPKIPRSICINTTGVSNGAISQKIINHIRDKYYNYNYNIFQVGLPSDRDFGGYNYRNYGIWEQIKILAECETFCGPDSFWYWVSNCYNMRRKVILTNITEQESYNFLPIPYQTNSWRGWLHCNAEFFNTFPVDMGVTRSYKEI